VPEADLTLPATVAAELGIASSDARLPRLIAAASAAIRAHLGRPQLHYSAAYVEKVAGFGGPRLVLGLTPVGAIASIVLGDGSTVTASEYTLEDAQAGLVYRTGCWPWTGLVRPGLLYSDPAMGTEKAEITVTYAGGWVTPAQAGSNGWTGPAQSLPADIEEAAVQTVVGLYRRGGLDPSIASEGLGDYSVSYRAEDPSLGSALPARALQLLAPYRRLIS
jgi:hypothetical protein